MSFSNINIAFFLIVKWRHFKYLYFHVTKLSNNLLYSHWMMRFSIIKDHSLLFFSYLSFRAECLTFSLPWLYAMPPSKEGLPWAPSLQSTAPLTVRPTAVPLYHVVLFTKRKAQKIYMPSYFIHLLVYYLFFQYNGTTWK